MLAEKNPIFRPKDWVKFRSSYFKFYTIKKSWQEARAICELEVGATLVSLNDKQEEDYVSKQMTSIGVEVFHIGLTAKGYPGRFEWLDGSRTSYTNWVNGSTERFIGQPLYVSVAQNGWFALDEEMRAGFTCKYTPG